MKRPLAYIGLGAFTALAAGAAFEQAAPFIAAACAVLSAGLFLMKAFKKKKTEGAASALLAAAAALLYLCAARDLYAKPLINEFDGKTAEFTGVITSRPFTYGSSTNFTVQTDTVNGVKRSIGISLWTSGVPDVGEYGRISGTAELYALGDEEKTGIDYASYSAAHDIFLGANISAYDKSSYYTAYENDSPPIWKLFSDARLFIESTLSENLSANEASICAAVTSGSDYMVPARLHDDFRSLGISHLLVVSGLHLSIAAGLLLILCERTIRSRLLSCAAELFGVYAFAALTGFSYSVRRALIMVTVLILARLFKAKADALNSLGLAALIICLNPFACGDIGLLWSFSSSFTIITLTPQIEGVLERGALLGKKRLSALRTLIAVSFAALVGTLPLNILTSKTISPYTLIANILTVPVTGVALLSSGLSSLLTAFGAESLGRVFMFIAGLTAKYLIWVTESLLQLPYARVAIDRVPVLIWAAVFILAAAVIRAVSSNKSYVRLTALFCAAALALTLSFTIFTHGDDVTITLTEVSQGTAALLKYPGGTGVLCCFGKSGSYSDIKKELSPELSFIVDTKPNGRSFDYGRKIAADFPPDTVIITSEKRENAYAWYEYRGGETQRCYDGCTLDLDGGVTVEIYSEEGAFCEFITVNGAAILIAGEGEIPERFRSPDIAVITEDSRLSDITGGAKLIAPQRKTEIVITPDGEISIGH